MCGWHVPLGPCLQDSVVTLLISLFILSKDHSHWVTHAMEADTQSAARCPGSLCISSRYYSDGRGARAH